MGNQAAPAVAQSVDLYRPIVGVQNGPAPLTLRVAVANRQSISEGVPAASLRVETYVMLSALPEELRRRVELAVQVLLAGR